MILCYILYFVQMIISVIIIYFQYKKILELQNYIRKKKDIEFLKSLSGKIIDKSDELIIDDGLDDLE